MPSPKVGQWTCRRYGLRACTLPLPHFSDQDTLIGRPVGTVVTSRMYEGESLVIPT